MSLLGKTLRRLGVTSRPASPSLLFYGNDRRAFEAIAPILKQLAKADQRLDAFLCADDAEIRRWLEQTFPEIVTVQPPLNISMAALTFVRRLRIRTVILLEDEVFPNPAFRDCLLRRSVSLVLMSGRGLAHLKPRQPAEEGANVLLAVDQQTTLPTPLDDRLTVIPSATPGGMDEDGAKAVLDRLFPLVGKNRKWINRRDRPLRRMFGRWLHRRLDDPAFADQWRRFVHRHDDLEQVRRALGDPETILCLGNGPSSEDPRLEEVAYDALFRVNHSWMHRPVLTEPDVVFTGGYSTMRVLKKPIFGLQHQTGEMVLLATRGPFSPLHPLRYFSMARLGSHLEDFDWGDHRPTNGSAMIAMAVALRPKRLIIAGVDLFRHPDGSYPGDTTTPNAYTPAHSSDKELAFMFHHLDRLQGEVVIFGEILDREWRHFRERHQHHLDEVG
jgi:hypothetical protein